MNPLVRFSAMLLLLLCAAMAMRAQEKNLIILRNADSLVGRTINGEEVREFHGHVRFVQGNVRVWCDRAFQYVARNELELIGHVRVVRDTVTLTAERGRYYGDLRKAVCEEGVRLATEHVTLLADYGDYYLDEKRAFFRSRVRVIDSTTTIHADELTYFEKERKSVGLHNVEIESSTDNVRIFGDSLTHFDSTHYSRMTVHPRLMQVDTSSKGEIDTLAVRSIVMESYDDSTKLLIATDSVRIVRGSMAARGGKVVYRRAAQYLDLDRMPVVWYEENQVTGDSVSLRMANNRLQWASIRGHAFAVSQSDSLFPERYNQLTGRRMFMTFAENKLKKIEVEQNAVSLYFLYDGKAPNGVNETSGDEISMTFVNGKPETIRVLRGVEGVYYPENMVTREPMKYNLDGFKLRSDRPVFSAIFPILPRP